ncbi:MAG: penicillin-binding protein 2 [Fimbriimonadales bacterium]
MRSRSKRRSVRNEQGSAGFWLPSVFLAFLFICVTFNQLRVQWFGRDEILHKAAEVDRLWSEDVIHAGRGEVMSSDGRLLAQTVPAMLLGIDGKNGDVPDNPAFWAELGDAAGASGAELRDYALREGPANDFDFVLTREQARKVAEVRRKYGADGVWTRSIERREYPLGKYAAPIVGFLDGKGVGHAGVEQSLSSLLAGKDGEVKGITDDTGHFLPWLDQGSKDAIAGANIELTIDADLQVAAMNALEAACIKHKASNGTAIVINPKTGDLLAMATYPTYNPDRVAEARRDAKAKGIASPELNPATQLIFEPGSTFKVFTLALGLETRAINLETTMHCTGTKVFSTAAMSCAGDHGGRSHGTVTPAKCMEVSCNLAAATWAVQMGFEVVTDMMKSLGLFELQMVGLPGEGKAVVNWDDYNKVIQTANLGFGQAMGVTPIGLASAFTVFANDGVRTYPRLIKRIDGKEQPIRRSERVFSSAVAGEVLHMMEAVVQGDHGTGKRLRIPGYRLAGKTGTAQKLGSSQLPGNQYVSNFIGYVPAENPQAVVLVMINEPQQGGYYGGVVAGPVFKDIAAKLLKDLRIPPSTGGANASQ